MRILIPTDGSEASLKAVEHAIKNSGRLKEVPEIHLLNVQLPILSGNVGLFIEQGKINDYYHDEGMAALKGAMERLDSAKVPFHFHIGVGHIAETIMRYAKEKKADQIWMGTKGMGAISGVILGSVTSKIIHLSEIPILLVK